MKKAGILFMILLFASAFNGFTVGSPDSTKTDEEPVTITLMRSDGLSAYIKQMKPDDIYLKELSRLSGYNIQYDWLEHSKATELLTLRFASGDLPDMIITDSVDSANHPGAIENNVFLELGPLIDKYGPNIKKKIPEEVWKSSMLSKNGKIYGLPWFAALPATRVIYVRQDWLDKLGMDTPDTLDDYLEFFQAVKTNDLNGNGENDELPFGVRENLWYSELFFRYFGVFPGAWHLENGKMAPDLLDPGMKEAIKFWKMLYEKGYVNQDMFIKKGGDWIKDIRAGKIALWCHDIQNLSSTWAASTFSNPERKLDVLPGPVNAKGERKLFPKTLGMGVWVVNAKTKHPAEIIKYYDWAISDNEEKEIFFAFGIEGHNHTVEGGKIVWDIKSPVNSPIDAPAPWGLFHVMIHPVKDNRMSPLLVDRALESDLVRKGIDVAKSVIFEHPDMNMPILKIMKTRPELGFSGGSLFLDMFAKVIIGREDVDSAFENFVSEWKRRGGDEAIKEATEWYKNY